MLLDSLADGGVSDADPADGSLVSAASCLGSESLALSTELEVVSVLDNPQCSKELEVDSVFKS